MKVALAAIYRCDEPMIAPRHERRDNAVQRDLARLDVPLPLADEILQLATSYVESVSNSDLNILMPTRARPDRD